MGDAGICSVEMIQMNEYKQIQGSQGKWNREGDGGDEAKGVTLE